MTLIGKYFGHSAAWRREGAFRRQDRPAQRRIPAHSGADALGWLRPEHQGREEPGAARDLGAAGQGEGSDRRLRRRSASCSRSRRAATRAPSRRRSARSARPARTATTTSAKNSSGLLRILGPAAAGLLLLGSPGRSARSRATPSAASTFRRRRAASGAIPRRATTRSPTPEAERSRRPSAPSTVPTSRRTPGGNRALDRAGLHAARCAKGAGPTARITSPRFRIPRSRASTTRTCATFGPICAACRRAAARASRTT
jgi:hypothetical protein